MEVVVVGAGSFGGSLAWWLARTGHRVTLVDQFEPGDPRSSSGGETRIFRCGHGVDRGYTVMARRARKLWQTLERESGQELLLECGVAWFAHQENGWEAESERILLAEKIPVERLDPDDASQLFPSFRSADLAFVLLEPEGGVFRAEKSIRTLAVQAVANGARLVRGRARPEGPTVVVEGSGRFEGDVVVWACGPWLGKLFPELVSLRVTTQELLFLRAGPAWGGDRVPGWLDYDDARYGTGDVDGLGVKAALDDEGPLVDPDDGVIVTTTTERDVRAYLGKRFPDLEQAPLLRARSCRYEVTEDTNFVAAPHPDVAGVWLVGGGSGHGFKHGPALAERLVETLTTGIELPAHFALGERGRGPSLRTAGSGQPG